MTERNKKKRRIQGVETHPPEIKRSWFKSNLFWVAVGSIGALLSGIMAVVSDAADKPAPAIQQNNNGGSNNVNGSNNVHVQGDNVRSGGGAVTNNSNNNNVTNNNSHNTTNINITPEALRSLTNAQDRLRTKAFPVEDYIDRSVHRVAGSLNVAVAVQGLPDSGRMLDAMHHALLQREMAVIPLFRAKFRQDGTARRLFAGDAALAANLRLREFVDSVLLAEFHFAGPAQLVEDNMYIREAVLEVRAIDPSSGEIRKTLAIREKGGGPTAEQSSENALTRLEQSIEDNISGWNWA